MNPYKIHKFSFQQRKLIKMEECSKNDNNERKEKKIMK